MRKYINPKIITWARERSHLSIEDLAMRIKRSSEEIEKWEDGVKEPAYGCLEELAYRYFHIPLAVFFFPEPPKEADPLNKFRKLPNFELERFSDDTYRKIRLAQAYQDSLSVILENFDSKKIFKDIKPETLSSSELARKVREYIGISIEKQYAFGSCETALKQWRHAIEESGIFTFKDSFKDMYISGFCLIDDEYPTIFINNSSSFSRQIFTLVHELGHILFGVNGVTDIDDTYLFYLDSKDRDTEVFCNNFAAQFLVPDDNFQEDIAFYKEHGIEAISRIADRYSVSREVILRRLMDKGIVSPQLYREKTAEWNRDYLRHRKELQGGNYYLTKLSYLGEGYTKLAFEQYHRGRIDKGDLTDYLNIKSKNLDKLEHRLRW